MRVTVTCRAGTTTGAYAVAVVQVAAALRDGLAVHVTTDRDPDRWTFTVRDGQISAAVLAPTLFDPTPAAPPWVDRLAASAAPLL